MGVVSVLEEAMVPCCVTSFSTRARCRLGSTCTLWQVKQFHLTLPFPFTWAVHLASKAYVKCTWILVGLSTSSTLAKPRTQPRQDSIQWSGASEG